MTAPSERELEHRLESIEESAGQQDSEAPITSKISVLWGAADPSNRPTGMTWVPAKGTLTYDVWDAQAEVLGAARNEETDIASFLAGFGSGKTVTGARWLLKQAIEHPDSRFLAMGTTFSKARDSTYRVLLEQLPGEDTHIVAGSFNGAETSPIVKDYDRQSHRLTLVNNTVIKLGSADKWSRHAGDSFGAVWLDEAAHYPDLHDLLEMIGSRLRGVPGPQTQLWTLTGHGQGEAFDILERGVDSTGEPLGLNVELIRASTLDNPYLSAGEKERFKRQYAGTAREQSALHGGFSSGTGALLKREQLEFVNADEVEEEQYRYHIGVDLAYVESRERAITQGSDHSAAVLLAVDARGENALLLDVDTIRGATLREQIRWLADVAGSIPNPTVKIESTGGQVYFVQEARQNVPGTVKAVNPNESKESRITDMSIVFERGDARLVNAEVDENLGYDSRWSRFVREWSEFGASDDSPDVLDATWLALHGLPLMQAGTFYSADPYSDRSSRQRGGGF